MDSVTLGQILSDFGLPLALLVVLVWSGAKRYWVFGWQYDRECQRADKAEQEADKWQQIAYESQATSGELVSAIRDSIDARAGNART